MEYEEARHRFIQAWGALGSSWGINKAMAQIHALLLVSTEPLSTDDIMSQLTMSRGNVNMNLRGLIDWGIVNKEHKEGDRKEYFTTDKDVWKLARQVSRERRRREIEPIIAVLKEVQEVSADSKKPVAEFKKVTKDLYDFSRNVDRMVELFAKSDKSWLHKIIKTFK